ncbi:MAG TPA: CAP domain-containing protein [Thermoanaerobaculia bacterium]
MKSSTAAATVALLAVARCATLATPPPQTPLEMRAPDLARPLTEFYPSVTQPEDPVKKGVFDRINADRAAFGLPAVAWDESASRVGDAFTADQVREGTNGHYLTDGLPPYARTGLAGVFGMGKENVVAWTTTGSTFHEPALGMALEGQAAMLAEKPPNDGHRLTILDPDLTHVGVGWAQGGGQFRMSEEFTTRRLAELTLQRVAKDPLTILVSGRTVSGQGLRFVTLAEEPLPRRLTKAQAHARSRYAYPLPRLAFVPEGYKSMMVVGATTEDRIRLGNAGDFSFRFTPGLPGLWTLVFHTSDGKDRAKPGGLAVLLVERADTAKAP